MHSSSKSLTLCNDSSLNHWHQNIRILTRHVYIRSIFLGRLSYLDCGFRPRPRLLERLDSHLLLACVGFASLRTAFIDSIIFWSSIYGIVKFVTGGSQWNLSTISSEWYRQLLNTLHLTRISARILLLWKFKMSSMLWSILIAHLESV